MYGQNDAVAGDQRKAVSFQANMANTTADKLVVERAPIDYGMNALQDRIETLHRMVSALEQRFSPALRSSPPTATGASPRPVEVVAGSPIGSLLSDRVSQLRDLENRIEDILSRCEL